MLRTAVAVRRQQAPPDTGVKMSPYYPQFRIQKYYELSLYVSTLHVLPKAQRHMGSRQSISAMTLLPTLSVQCPSYRQTMTVPKHPDSLSSHTLATRHLLLAQHQAHLACCHTLAIIALSRTRSLHTLPSTPLQWTRLFESL